MEDGQHVKIRCLGDDMTRRGWKDRLIGKPISPNTLHEFLSLKNLHLKKKHLKQMPSKTLSKEYIMAWIEENTCNVKGRKYIDLDDF